MINVNEELVDLSTFVMDLQSVGEIRISGEMAEVVITDMNAYENTYTDYDEETGEPFVAYTRHTERIPLTLLKKTIIPAGTIYNDEELEADLTILDDKGSEALILEAKEKARSRFASYYAGKNLQKAIPNGTTIYEGTA